MYNTIVLIGTGSKTQNIIFKNCIEKRRVQNHYLVEKKISKWKLLKNRYKKVGFVKLLDIITFQVLIQKIDRFLFQISKKNENAIKIKNSINLDSSVNSSKSIAIVKALNPDLIIIAGTRILSSRFISSIDCKIINIHLGLTPKYRGVLGGIWPQLKMDSKNVGVTLHYVNAGIDTGQIISQQRVSPKGVFRIEEINQNLLEEGCVLLNTFLDKPLDYIGKNLALTKSELSYHPGISDYLKYLWKKFLSV